MSDPWCPKCARFHASLTVCPMDGPTAMDVHSMGRAGISIVESWLVEEKAKNSTLREALERIAEYDYRDGNIQSVITIARATLDAAKGDES